jgi:hypothetical protein
VGGPVFLPKIYDGRNRTFFFASYEGLQLRQPFVTNPLQVPSLAARQNATGVVKDLLNAFPLPTGSASATTPDSAPYIGAFSSPSKLNAASFKIDHTLSSRFSVFGRYNYAPSESQERAKYCAASCVSVNEALTETFTGGATMVISPRLVNDLRLNYSKAKTNLSYFTDTFGEAVVPPASSLYPSFTTGDKGYIYIEVDPSGDNTLTDGLFVENRQRQFNLVDTAAITLGQHDFKFGVDYRRLSPTTNSGSYRRSFFFTSVAQLATGIAPTFAIVSPDVVLNPIFQNFSAFAQDTWRASSRLTLTYGVRYEVVPAPSEANGRNPVTVIGLDDLTQLRLAPDNAPFYATKYGNFAPRLGFALRLDSSGRSILRAGTGLFYDLGYNFTGTAFSTSQYPYARSLNAANVSFDAPLASSQAPPVNRNPPYPRLFAYQQDYKLPLTWQYNIALERAVGQNGTATLSYVGAAARRLSRVESLRNVLPAFARIDAVRNDARSDYHSLQAQFQQRFAAGFQGLVSYTFGKSLDTVSDESNSNLQAPSGMLSPSGDRGPSSFDVRHSFNGAVSYELPAYFQSRFPKAVLNGWAFDLMFRARSATPVNVVTGRDSIGLGITTVSRPDLVAGVPLYLESELLPGGRRFNPAAFDAATPAAQRRQGTLGRNVLRGFPAVQADFSLRREFDLREGTALQLRMEAFNLFNHPNFYNPSGVLSSSNFGRATQMLGSGLSGLSPLFQIGGTRSIQVALKLLF